MLELRIPTVEEIAEARFKNRQYRLDDLVLDAEADGCDEEARILADAKLAIRRTAEGRQG